ncbi:O-antigen ligase family protein [Paenibacillus albidus]|uniref:O-antigen ligase family protein n=1 Tax=Paenibacillus albidus TaxID=2041023 RepID=UPI001BEC9FB3|nr:O-antigen ligase family protein [Paenibacillus albidus]MBT2292472.1 O-antigen ligase family protein [Paenibacillus albidus]
MQLSPHERFITYTCAAAVLAAGVGACLLRGLFFIDEAYPVLTGWFVLCAVLAVLRQKKPAYALEQPVHLRYSGGGRRLAKGALLTGPAILLTLYVIHALREPLSAQGTLNEILRWGLYASFVWVAIHSGRHLLAAAWHIVGLTLCLSALLAVCGVLQLPFGVAYSGSPEVSAAGARLAGLLEYPNAFGAVMAVFLLERLFAVADYYASAEPGSRGSSESTSGAGSVASRSEAGSGQSTYTAEGGGSGRGTAGAATPNAALLRLLLLLLPLFPYTAALLLSESRGAWLAAVCASAAALAWKRRLLAPLLAAGAAPVAAAALLYRELAPARLAVEPLPGLLLLAGLWAGALLAGLWLCRRGCGAAGKGKVAALLLAAAGWTAAGFAVFEQVRERITGPSSTVSARALLYRDAWRLAGEAPWLGQGGETWRSAYLAAQSRPYVGSQVHSGYLDLLLNLGAAGVAVAGLMLLAAGWLLVLYAPRLLPPFLVLVLHSAVDFDWSYGLFWLLLLWLPALALTAAPAIPAKVRTTGASSGGISRLYTIGGCCCCLLLGLLSYRAGHAAELYRHAAYTAESMDREGLLRQALVWNPVSTRTALKLSRLLPAEQALDLLRSSLQYAPESAALHWEVAERYAQADNAAAALHWIRRSLRLDLYNYAKWEEGARYMLQLGTRKLESGEAEAAQRCGAAGLELLRQYRLRVQLDERGGKRHNDRRFAFTEEAGAIGRELERIMRKRETAEGERRSVTGLSFYSSEP